MIMGMYFVSSIVLHYDNNNILEDAKIKTMDYDDVFGDIKVTSPRRSDILQTGTKFVIKWDSMGGIEFVTIALYKNSEFVDTIAIVTKNDGEYEWMVGNYEEGFYSIGIWDYQDFNTNDFSEKFQITNNDQMSINSTLEPFIFISILFAVISSFIMFIKKKLERSPITKHFF